MKANNFLYLIFIFLTFSANLFAAEILEDNQGISVDKIDSSRFYSKAVLQLLNKTNAKSFVVEAKINEELQFGKLTIIPKKCWQAPLDQKPDSKILLDVYETDSEIGKKRIFFGWMIASSPSVSSLEHPIYDITALNCKK